jgi:hypothetical protein
MDDKKLKELQRLSAMAKLGSSPIKSPDYVSPLENDVMKVKGGDLPEDSVTKIKNATQKIDTKEIAPILSGSDFEQKIAKLRALKAAGKKVAGIIPFAGAGMAALSGDPAMAAEELASDAMGPAGMAYDALKPDVAGNPEEESMMLAERDAMENYKNSPAGKAAKLAKLKALMQK